jgi:hypothetical protein
MKHVEWIIGCVLVVACVVCIAIMMRSRCFYNESIDSQIMELFDTFVQGRRLKDIDMTMRICAPDIIANAQWAPRERTYADIRAGTLWEFNDTAIEYAHSYEIKEIFHAGDLAVVRVVWTLQLIDTSTRELIETSTEIGMDLFRRTNNGWQLFRFIAYPQKSIEVG